MHFENSYIEWIQWKLKKREVEREFELKITRSLWWKWGKRELKVVENNQQENCNESNHPFCPIENSNKKYHCQL